MKPVNAFPGLLHAFFYERLVQQLNVSPHTVRSYRDTWRLFRFTLTSGRSNVKQTSARMPPLPGNLRRSFTLRSPADYARNRQLAIPAAWHRPPTRTCALAPTTA
jgi:hypothetical protein